MNSSFNTRLTNRNQKQGNVASYFENLRNLVQINDGTRSFITKTTDCHDQPAPLPAEEWTYVDITNEGHDISQITDGFETYKVEAMIKVVGLNSASFNDTNHLFKLNIGFKSSNQLVDDQFIYCNNIDTGYHNQECVREGMAYSAIKPLQEKKTKKYIHTLYENVENYSESIAGAYINCADFKDGLAHPVEWEMNVPFEDYLPLQAFDLFPNSICGNLKFHRKHTPKGLVWAPVNPLKVKDSKELYEGELINMILPANIAALYKHGFTQIGNSAQAISAITITAGANEGDPSTLAATSGSIQVICDGLRIISEKSTMYGFNVHPASKEYIKSLFAEPMIMPSQQISFHTFPHAANDGGIDSTLTIPVSNATCMSIVFPKYSNEYTVLENPMYQNLQLTVNSDTYPNQPVSTLGARFLQQQLIASDLSGGLEATKEFEDSMTMPRNQPNGTRYLNTLRDATCFMWNVQVERNNAGYTFDGVQSGSGSIPIQLRGIPIYNGTNDTYYNVKQSGGTWIHPPPPQLWMCRDTYFTLYVGGMKYHKTGTPPGYSLIDDEKRKADPQL